MNPVDVGMTDNFFLKWGVFLVLVPILLVCDLFIFSRKDHVIGAEGKPADEWVLCWYRLAVWALGLFCRGGE